ncbi:MAG: hypothetical protein ACRC9L_07425 [Brevinema sp.]
MKNRNYMIIMLMLAMPFFIGCNILQLSPMSVQELLPDEEETLSPDENPNGNPDDTGGNPDDGGGNTEPVVTELTDILKNFTWVDNPIKYAITHTIDPTTGDASFRFSFNNNQTYTNTYTATFVEKLSEDSYLYHLYGPAEYRGSYMLYRTGRKDSSGIYIRMGLTEALARSIVEQDLYTSVYMYRSDVILPEKVPLTFPEFLLTSDPWRATNPMSGDLYLNLKFLEATETTFRVRTTLGPVSASGGYYGLIRKQGEPGKWSFKAIYGLLTTGIIDSHFHRYLLIDTPENAYYYDIRIVNYSTLEEAEAGWKSPVAIQNTDLYRGYTKN